MSRLIQYIELGKKYGILKALGICQNLLLKKNIAISIRGIPFLMNPEGSAVYHLLHSIDKLERMVEAIPDDVSGYVLDIGANCGLFSLLTQRRFPSTQIYAFEPSTQLQSILQHNLAQKNIHIVQAVVSDVDDLVELYTNPQSQQTNSILQSSVEVFAETIEVEQVPAMRLDTFLHERGISQVDVIKIDVQGAEKLVLNGAEQSLQETKYLILEVTFLDPGIFETLKEVRSLFPYYKAVGPVLYGADILFSKHPIS